MVEKTLRTAWTGLESELKRRALLLLVAVVLVSAFGSVIAATYAYNIVKKFENVAVEPAGREIGVFAPIEKLCPSGWKNTTTESEHGFVPSCSQGGWLVIVHPDGKFNYGLHEVTPGVFAPNFEFEAGKVPGWPVGR